MEGFSGFRLYPLQKVIGDLFVIAVVTPYLEEILHVISFPRMS